jgi:hypothetical protein
MVARINPDPSFLNPNLDIHPELDGFKYTDATAERNPANITLVKMHYGNYQSSAIASDHETITCYGFGQRRTAYNNWVRNKRHWAFPYYTYSRFKSVRDDWRTVTFYGGASTAYFDTDSGTQIPYPEPYIPKNKSGLVKFSFVASVSFDPSQVPGAQSRVYLGLASGHNWDEQEGSLLVIRPVSAYFINGVHCAQLNNDENAYPLKIRCGQGLLCASEGQSSNSLGLYPVVIVRAPDGPDTLELKIGDSSTGLDGGIVMWLHR